MVTDDRNSGCLEEVLGACTVLLPWGRLVMISTSLQCLTALTLFFYRFILRHSSRDFDPCRDDGGAGRECARCIQGPLVLATGVPRDSNRPCRGPWPYPGISTNEVAVKEPTECCSLYCLLKSNDFKGGGLNSNLVVC